MSGVLLRWLLNAAGLWALIAITGKLMPGSVKIEGFVFALLAILVLGLLNAVIRPVVKLLTIPLNCLTLGLFGIVVNLVFFYLAFKITPGFTIDWSLGTFLILYLGMTIISAAVSLLIRKGR